jgi:DNA-directed RNA polymerase subunit alpha
LVVDADPQNDRARRYLENANASSTQYYDESRERSADKQNAVLRIPVTDFELSVRARNCLQRMNIHTLGDLVSRTESELLSFKNFGETSLQEVKDILLMKGLRLGMMPSMDVGPAASAATAGPTAGTGDVMEILISELDLSVRSRAALAMLGITRVRELTQANETTLMSCKNFGQTSLDEIRSKLRNLGLEIAR